MNLSTKFKSNENKGLIWTLLEESGYFHNIPNDCASQVRNDFDRIVNECSVKLTSNDLTACNKTVINKIVGELGKYKQSLPSSEQKKEGFSNNLETRQQEFSSLINGQKPKEIDFKDKVDEPFGDKMDDALQEAINMREKQLNQVMQNQNPKQAKKWINNSKNIVIGEETELPTPQTVNVTKKHVTFKEDNIGGFLNKLKVEGNDDENLLKDCHTILKDVISNQNEILKLLRK